MTQNDANASPAELPRFDPDQLTVEESYGIYKELQQRCPVLHSAARGGFHLLTRYQNVREAALPVEFMPRHAQPL